MRLLLAEDDRQLRLSIARGLREALYAVDQAATGPQALALTTEHSYDALILDVLLPGMSGIAVCQSVRTRGDQVPILMLTALDGVDKRIAGLDAGADDYLTKPFDFGELLARLRSLTRRRGEVLPSQLVIGDLVIDTLRRSAHRNRRELTLTAKEFTLLLHLARNAGRVVSRDEIMAHVWNDSGSGSSNVLDVYASRLRRKLDEGEKFPLFKTFRGAGLLIDDRAAELPRTAARSSTRRRE